MPLIRVLVSHRSRLVRDALAAALEKSGFFEVADAAPSASTETPEELTDIVRHFSPDVIVLDLDFPFRTGLSDACRVLKMSPNARVVLTGVPFVESEIMACIETGVAGCELESATLPELVKIITGVHSGEHQCSPQITRLLFRAVSGRARSFHQQATRTDVHLTRRELEVIELVEGGFCNKEIAVHLGIEVQTVKNHVHNVLDKLHLRGRRDAARYARDLGLLRGSRENP